MHSYFVFGNISLFVHVSSELKKHIKFVQFCYICNRMNRKKVLFNFWYNEIFIAVFYPLVFLLCRVCSSLSNVVRFEAYYFKSFELWNFKIVLPENYVHENHFCRVVLTSWVYWIDIGAKKSWIMPNHTKYYNISFLDYYHLTLNTRKNKHEFFTIIVFISVSNKH